MKPVFAFYEGPHDTAFLGRLLKLANVKPYERPLSQYEPTVLGKFLIRRYEKRDVGMGRFRGSGTNQGTFVHDHLPVFDAAYELVEPSRLLLFHRCVGDNHEAVRELLSELVVLSAPGASDIGLPSFGVLFIRDADDTGIESKVAELRRMFGEVLAPVLPSFAGLSANSPEAIIRDGEFSAGCCVFSAPGKDTGTLEDIVWPLLYARIPGRLDGARQFIDEHGIAGTEIARGRNPAAKRLKAALTIAGQIDAPGYSLTVALRDTPEFDDADLRADGSCQILTRMVLEM